MIPMMLQSKRVEYREGGGYQAVRLPYEGNNLLMYIFLPDVHTPYQGARREGPDWLHAWLAKSMPDWTTGVAAGWLAWHDAPRVV